jgi:hypothetical protein
MNTLEIFGEHEQLLAKINLVINTANETVAEFCTVKIRFIDSGIVTSYKVYSADKLLEDCTFEGLHLTGKKVNKGDLERVNFTFKPFKNEVIQYSQQ